MEANKHGLFIANRWVAPGNGGYFETIDPATEEPIAEVARGGAASAGLSPPVPR